jgi:hypothetical protein
VDALGLEQVGEDRAEHLGAQPLPVAARGEEDVELRVGVLLVTRLTVLHGPHDLAVRALDHEDAVPLAGLDELAAYAVGVVSRPEAGDGGLGEDAGERLDVGALRGAEAEAGGEEHDRSLAQIVGTHRPLG